MLVTKKEVKQTSKKALSLLLALVMLMTSMSVCFGTFTMASAEELTAAQQLADAFKVESMERLTVNRTSSSTSGNNYTLRIDGKDTIAKYADYAAVKDVMTKLDAAVKSLAEYKEKATHNSSGDCEASRTYCTDFAKLKDALIGELEMSTADRTTYNVDTLLNAVFDMTNATKFSTNENGTKCSDRFTNVVTYSTTDVLGYVQYVGKYTDLKSADPMTQTYTIGMSRQNYQTKSGTGCNQSTQDHYHHALNTNNTANQIATTKKVSDNDSSKLLTAVTNYASNTVLANYNTYHAAADGFDKLLDLAGKAATDGTDRNQLEVLLANFKSSRDSITTTVGGNSYFEKLYADILDEYNTFVADCESALSFADMMPAVNGWKDFEKTSHPDYGRFNWGAFDEATIRADFNTFKINYYNVLKQNNTVYNYFINKGEITEAYYTNFYDNVVAFDLNALKNNLVDPLYDEYSLSYDDEGVTTLEKQVAYSNLTGYINNIRSYSTQVQNAIFTSGIAHLLDLQQKLQCQIDENVLYFAENVNKDYSDVKTDDVISEIATAKDKLAALNAFKATVADANKPLLDTPLANADTFIAYLYNLLAERIIEQVDHAAEVYVELNRPTTLDIIKFSKINAALKNIDEVIFEYLPGAGKGDLIPAATTDKYNDLKANIYDAYNAFLADRGFKNYDKIDTTIVRNENSDEFFREGNYTVTEENVENIIALIEELLKDPTIAGILGDLINKDKETGEPTGEPFDLANLINGLLDSIYTDDIINTIIQFVYPLVGKEFAKVWAGLPADFTTKTTVSGMDCDVYATLKLDDVNTAISAVGMYLFPNTLGENIRKNYPAYADVAAVLEQVTLKPEFDKEADKFTKDPWAADILYTEVLDDDGNVVIDESTGEAKKKLAFEWGVTDRASFIDAACAALSGLEPLLFALISNKYFVNENTNGLNNSDIRGCRIGSSGANSTATLSLGTLPLVIDPITLMFEIQGNDGYDNVIAPLFEALGLENIPHGETLTTTRKLLEDGLFAMLDQFIAKLAANPVNTLLEALPNLAYVLEADMIQNALRLLEIEIYYEADAYYSATIPSGLALVAGLAGLSNPTTGTMQGAMKAEKDVDTDGDGVNDKKIKDPIFINIGDMLNLKDLGLDISSFNAIWNMLSGIELLNGVEAPEAGKIALMGDLTAKATNRSKYAYTYTPGDKNAADAGKAWYIEANKADILTYLVQWVLESGLLNGIVKNPEGLVADIFANLANNPNGAIAAIVELLNQQAYDAKEYKWFNGLYNGESVVGNSAYEIYLNPNNDWTKEKAEYLYNNIDAILTAALTMAGADFDLGATIGGAVDGLLTDKTLTALAALLAKLDLNEMLNKNKTEEEKAKALDVNALIESYLGLDLAAIAATYADIAAAVEADPAYVADFGVDAGTRTFAAALAEMLAPLNTVLAYLLDGGNLELTIGGEKVTLLGGNGFNNAIVPLLEALGCTIPEEGTSLEKTINALVAKIDALTEGDVIKNIINLLPGVFYFITSNGLSTAVMNLLQPILTIVDIVNPVIDVMDLINGLEIGEEGSKQTIAELLGGEIDLKHLDVAFIFDLLPALVPAIADLDLSDLEDLIYDICNEVGTEYTSAAAVANTVDGKAKKGAYTEDFDQADLLTVVLSFVLEWATVKENAEALDAMLGTNGIIAGLNSVFADVEITYGTPEWFYWYEGDESAYDKYVTGEESLPNTLYALEYPNDWSAESAQYIVDNLAKLVDMVIGLIDINGVKYENLSTLLNALIKDYISADTINMLLDMLKGVLANIDDTLLGAGYLLDVDLVGLKNYTCEKEITTISELVAELAFILDKYAPTLVNLLFFGDDIRLAKKSDKTDTIVINGGLGYEKGLALILEALGCDVPAADEATTAKVLAALATRVEAILANPVNEVMDLLPNLVYFLNANGASVAVNNLLAPVYTIIDKINALNLMDEIKLVDLLGFDLKYLSLADILKLVKDKTGLDLKAAEEILVNLCFGKVEENKFGYKMVADRKDVITVVLTTALMLVSDDAFAAKLEELLGTDVISAIKTVFADVTVEYGEVDWDYAFANNGTTDLIDYAITYPNNWTESTAEYLVDNLPEIGDMVANLIDSKYVSLGALLGDKVNALYTPDVLAGIQKALGDLIGGLDADLKKLVNVGLGAADKLLGADVQGLLNYDVSGVKDKETFVAALTGMLMEVEGLVDWLLFGEDYKFFVDNNKNDIITINGAHGYAEGLALLLEALGCEELPAVYGKETIDTEATIKAVLTSLVNRIDAIIADPVNEVFELLPNIFYFLNTNGVSVVINNTIAAINALLTKLAAFGIELDILALVDLKSILKVETDISLNNITMETLLAVAGELTGLNLAAIEDVLVGFALGQVTEYDSVSINAAKKMTLKSDFDKHDLITVVATLALITLDDDANAEVLKGLVGESAYKLINNLLHMENINVDMQDIAWDYVAEDGSFDPDVLYSAIDNKNEVYGEIYTVTESEYIADNFGEFVDNVIYLLGLDINGDGTAEGTLTDVIDELLNGNLYTAANVIAIRDALAGILAKIGTLEVKGANVGKYIVEVLKEAGVADFAAVAEVEVDFDTGDKEGFVAALCDVLEPLYPVLKFLLATEDFSFFVKGEKADAITLKGAEGYAYGIIPLLEAIGCKDVMTSAEYYAAVEANGDVLLTSIINPLLARVDEILANPADEILAILPNIIYFVNSNGVDTVVRNTLNAVYTVLAAIEPIAVIDLYALIGIDLAEIDFDWLLKKAVELLNGMGYNFKVEDFNAIAELTVGKLESYTSANGKTAYRMVYAPNGGINGGKAEMVTAIEVLAIEFLTDPANQEVAVKFLSEKLGMNKTAENYVRSTIKFLAECVNDTSVGMQSALAAVYYLFYGVDTGVDNTVGGMNDLNNAWKDAIGDLKEENPAAGDLIEEILGWDVFEDVLDTDNGVAPNGLIRFFQKITGFFQSIANFFKNLFSFGK